MGRWMWKIKNKQYGQAMVEFALTLPIFLLLVFGVIELSRFFLVYSSVYTATREASRFGSSVGSGSTNYMNCTEIKQTAVRMGNFGGVQIDDVSVYYESSPGTVAGICDDTLDADQRYEPELGDRLVVDVESEFVSLLGIIPSLPIRSVNGRTIMMNIILERTPEPFIYDSCKNHVSLVVPTEGSTLSVEGNNILKISFKNTSTTSTYTILEINKLTWTGTPNLIEVRWAGQTEPIWKTDVEGGRTSGFSLPTAPIEGVPDYWNLYLRNLYPAPTEDSATTGELKFIFYDEVVIEDIQSIGLGFDVVMHHTNVFADKCTYTISN